jgi:hypothetical protein
MVGRCWATSSSHPRIAPDATRLAHESLDETGSPPGAGTLFGLKTAGDVKVYFVDDGSNTLNLLHSFPSRAGRRAQPTCCIIHAVAGLVACRRSISAVTSFAG